MSAFWIGFINAVITIALWEAICWAHHRCKLWLRQRREQRCPRLKRMAELLDEMDRASAECHGHFENVEKISKEPASNSTLEAIRLAQVRHREAKARFGLAAAEWRKLRG